MLYTVTTNTLKRIIIPSIASRESNEDRGQLYMFLYKRRYIHIDDWVELTIEDEVIKRVKELEKLRNNPLFTKIQCLSGQQE